MWTSPTKPSWRASPQERSQEGQTWAPIQVETQLASTEEPTNEPTPTEISTEEAAPTEEPTKQLAPAEASTEQVGPTEDPTEELTTLMAMVSSLAEEPDIPPVQHEKEKGEVPHSNFPGWTEVLHPTWSVIPRGQTSQLLAG